MHWLALWALGLTALLAPHEESCKASSIVIALFARHCSCAD